MTDALTGIGSHAFRPHGWCDEGQGKETLRTREALDAWHPLVDWEEIFPGNRGVARSGEYLLFDAPVGIRLRVETARKSEPIVRSEPDREGGGGLHPVLAWQEDAAAGYRYHLLYGAFPANGQSTLRYARSRDGVHFEKAEQVSDGPAHCGMFIDPTAPPAERFKAMRMDGGYFDPDTGEKLASPEWERRMAAIDYAGAGYAGPGMVNRNWLQGWTSPDGMHWTAIKEPIADMPADGGIAPGYDAATASYFAYVRPGGTGRRSIALTKTTDFHRWPAARLVLHADPGDPPDTSFYGLYHFSYPGRQDLHVGLVQVYHQIGDYGDTQLAFSRDGLYWPRPERRPVIRVGVPGSEQAGIVWPWGVGLITLPDGSWAIPYDGTSWLHNAGAAMPRGNGIIAWARWRPHRLCGIEARAEGRFTIQTIKPSGSRLRLNYRCRAGGWIRVELLRSIPSRLNPDVTGTAGYTFAECDVLTGDNEDAAVSWRGNSDLAAAGSTIVIRIELFAAKIYAYHI
jgi:hypothetical protein